MVSRMAEAGVNWIAFNIAIPNIQSEVFEDDLQTTDAISQMHNILDEGKRLGANIHFAASVPLCLAEKDGALDSHFRGNCFVFHGNALVIDHNGSIIPCVHWVEAPIDSIYRTDGKRKSITGFLRGWNNGLPSEFRQSLLRYPSHRCSTCEHWGTKCVGGCPLMRLGRDISKDIDALGKEVVLK